MGIYLDTELLKPGAEKVRAALACIFCDHYAAHIKASFFKNVDKAQYVGIISNAKISPDFVFFNICSTDDNDDLCLI